MQRRTAATITAIAAIAAIITAASPGSGRAESLPPIPVGCRDVAARYAGAALAAARSPQAWRLAEREETGTALLDAGCPAGLLLAINFAVRGYPLPTPGDDHDPS